jgi:hypothetical protein
MNMKTFPATCPKCQAMTTFPDRMTIDDRITAEIRCRSCNHVWIAFAQIQPIIAKRKKDRRQAERDIR